MTRVQVGALVLVVCCGMDAVAQAPPTRMNEDIINATRSGGLPAAAALVGHYVALDDGDIHGSLPDLYRLATWSDVVVLAQVVSTSPSQLSGPLSISTDYQLTVVERFQGPISVGAPVTVRRNGGRVTFANGTSAEIRASRLPAGLEQGREYVFFLKQLQGQPVVYETVLGPQGLFAFTQDSHVFSPARDIDDLYKQYNGMAKADFLAQVRANTIP